MNRARPIIVMLMLLWCVSAVSQTPREPQRLVIYTSDHTLNSGFYLDLSTDSLLLLSDDAELAVPIDDLVRVDRLIVRERELGPIGMMVGFYGSIALEAMSESDYIDEEYCPQCRTGYVTSGGLTFALGLVESLPIGLLGYLLDNSNTSPEAIGGRETITFDGDPEQRRMRKEELARSIRRASRRPLSIGVHGGYIVSGTGTPFAEELNRAGYQAASVNTNRFDSYFANSISSLLWLRRAEIHYRLLEKTDIGLSYVNLADPGTVLQRIDPIDRGSRVRTVSEGNSGSAYLVTGRYRAFEESRFGSDLVVTAGAGMTSFRHHRFGFDDTLASNGSTRGSGSSALFEGTTPAGLVAVEYSLPITPATTLGVSADWLVTPATPLPGTPSLEIPERQMSPGNASIGFALGWRF
jgi:hypothetical protein